MKLFQKSPKGFTLIELLVVIAIIAILAAMILVSVGGARTKSRETRAQAELSSMRAQAELYYNSHNFSYGATTGGVSDCTANDNLFADSADTQNSLARLISSVDSVASDMYCGTDGAQWAVAATLSSGVFCADSNGVAKMNTGMTAADDAITNDQCI